MAPCESASHTSSGTSWSSWAASSERRRMNPTWGPLPCPMATCQPSLMIDAICPLVSPRACIWSGMDMCWASLMRELPPMATTRIRFDMVVRPSGAAGPADASAHRQRHDRLLGVQPVLRLVVDDRPAAVDDLVGD